MRLPRRSAFSDPSRDLPHLHALLYPSPHCPDPSAARARGVDLVQNLYLARGGCPVAVECTASLVSGVLLDEHLARSATATPGVLLDLPLRQTLALTVIRLVNSLADAQQRGAYARSIAHIAEHQLGLPQWLVEFRHRATHEELPSLEVCREAVGAALVWLGQRYWAGALREARRSVRVRVSHGNAQERSSPAKRKRPAEEEEDHTDTDADHDHDTASAAALLFTAPAQPQRTRAPGAAIPTPTAPRPATPASQVLDTLPALRTHIKAYKRLSKTCLRDESLRSRSRPGFTAIYRHIDRWIAAGAATYERAQVQAQAQGAGAPAWGGGRSRLHSNDGDDNDDAEMDAPDAPSTPRQTPLDTTTPHDVVLALVFEELLQPGGLVPLSKAKRVRATPSPHQRKVPLPALEGQHEREREREREHQHSPTAHLLPAWLPLLAHLAQSFPSSPGLLLDVILRALGPKPHGTPVVPRSSLLPSTPARTRLRQRREKSFRLTLYAWARALLESGLGLGIARAPSDDLGRGVRAYFRRGACPGVRPLRGGAGGGAGSELDTPQGEQGDGDADTRTRTRTRAHGRGDGGDTPPPRLFLRNVCTRALLLLDRGRATQQHSSDGEGDGEGESDVESYGYGYARATDADADGAPLLPVLRFLAEQTREQAAHRGEADADADAQDLAHLRDLLELGVRRVEVHSQCQDRTRAPSPLPLDDGGGEDAQRRGADAEADESYLKGFDFLSGRMDVDVDASGPAPADGLPYADADAGAGAGAGEVDILASMQRRWASLLGPSPPPSPSPSRTSPTLASPSPSPSRAPAPAPAAPPAPSTAEAEGGAHADATADAHAHAGAAEDRDTPLPLPLPLPLPEGWTRAPPGWRPTPVGCLAGRRLWDFEGEGGGQPSRSGSPRGR